jgi:hypothetical protein
MSIKAMAVVFQCSVNFTNQHYEVVLHVAATDQVTNNIEVDCIAYVPFQLSFKKADNFVRQAVVDKILSSFGWVIDPDDIYFPTP